jgi:membrane associated rhomboid family serine protease
MLIPYSTDAPVYYWPFATVGLIVANVAIFIGVAFYDVSPVENWVLWYGDGLHPEQWFLSMFMHGGLEHLIGNMIFLWVFGLVVEGKLGWYKFLVIYLAIGMSQCMIEQIVMLGAEEPTPGSLGASAAIFGLVAIAAVWAPLNEVSFFWLFWVRAGSFDIGIAVLAAVYIGFEILMICIFGTDAGSSWLHLAGFAIGAPIGILLLKSGIVDCEGWDLFHVWAGDYGAFKKEPDAKEELAKVDAHKKKQDDQMLSDAATLFGTYMKNGNVPAAIKLFEKMKGVSGGLKLQRNELLAFVQTLLAAKRWKDCAPFMAEFIARFPEGAEAMRIKLAQICVVELQRPGKAIDVLTGVDVRRLPEKQATLVKRIRAKAEEMQQEGVVELDVETW